METLATLRKKRAVLILATLSLGGALLWLLTSGSAPPPGPLPPMSLTFLGLSNFGTFGVTSAYSISNASPKQLFFAPSTFEFTAGTGSNTVPYNQVLNAAAILGPGKAHTFYVPGTITNQSLRIHTTFRERAKPASFRGKAEWFSRKVGPKNGDAWMGTAYQGVLVENSGNASAAEK
jgi:hypothetical protein